MIQRCPLGFYISCSYMTVWHNIFMRFIWTVHLEVNSANYLKLFLQ